MSSVLHILIKKLLSRLSLLYCLGPKSFLHLLVLHYIRIRPSFEEIWHKINEDLMEDLTSADALIFS